jgi:phage FluMu gp28-like protein
MEPTYKAGAWSIHRTPITLAAPELGTDLDELKAAVDDDETWKQEFLALFIDGSNVLLPYDLMAKCESMEATLSITPEEMDGRGPWFCGIDFGRTSDPSVLWLLEKVGDILWTRAVIVLKNENTVDQFNILKPYIERCASVAVDWTGPGVGFGDILEKHYFTCRSTGAQFGGEKIELCSFTAPFKCDIFPKLRSAFDAVRLRVPFSSDTREDLHEMQQIVSNGKYTYSAPRTAAGHSDRCTALALALRAASRGAIYIPPFSTRMNHNPDTRSI